MIQDLLTPSKRGTAALRVAIFFFGLVFAIGCVSVEQMGDRAFEAGNHKEAQTYYKQAMEEGSQSSELYQKAARNELRLGNLASAERYYTMALKYGGDDELAKELARFYIQTSNYASAVRMYQYLLYRVKNPQPVYNNLGTALIYAGRPFDAESHLLVAQQMDPADPLPYLNLGLLYDQHLKQPWLAVNFYDCFVTMTNDGQQRQQAAQRSREIQAQWARLYDPKALACGKVYEPVPDRAPVENLVDAVGGPVELDTAAPTTPKEPSDVIIERMVEDFLPAETKLVEPKKEEPPVAEEPPKKAEEAPPAAVADGRTAFAARKWSDVVDKMTSVPLRDLQSSDLAMLGAAYFQLGEYESSVQWLEVVTGKEPRADYVILLVDAQVRLGDLEAVTQTCRRHSSGEDKAKVAEHCKKRLESLQKSKGSKTGKSEAGRP